MGMFLIVFLFMALIVIAMSVGVIFGRKPIAGSCGGMSALGMETACEICGGDKTKCEKETVKAGAGEGTGLFYDATDQENSDRR